MATRKHLGRSRALRPLAEGLEGRQLLSATVSGTNTAGDHWTLTLKGRGSLQVIKQNDATGSPGALNSATEIRSIIISGTDPNTTRVTEKVTRATGSTGRIFFKTLTEVPNRSEKLGTGLGIESINIPDFYLGDTASTAATTSGQPRASISIPDGINSLRFGGADTTAFFGTDPTQSVAQSGQNDQFLVRLGIPQALGTSIVVNRITSGAQAATTSGTGQAGSPTQKSVVFQVGGRINLFEANQIDGNTQIAPAAASFNAGTIVASLPDASTGVTGQIGFVRIGGNATNFSAVTNDRISNFYIGGETNNVSVLAPSGSRNYYFGKGADTVTILTHSIENLEANRGMVNSRVVSERMIGDIKLGGDVVNSTVLSGYQQGLTGIINTIESNETQFGQFFQTAVTAPVPTAQAAGDITAFIAGNVTNSVFAASDNPISQATATTTANVTFGNPADVLLGLGKIVARVQGSIDNSSATPDMPKTAFYAQTVTRTHGVVVPPNVVEPPLPPPATPVHLRGIPKVFPATSNTTATGGKNNTTGSINSPGGIF